MSTVTPTALLDGLRALATRRPSPFTLGLPWSEPGFGRRALEALLGGDIAPGPLRDVSRDRASVQADVVARALGVGPGATVLELACGPGFVALELARRGICVVGVDDFGLAVSHAQQAAAAAHLPVTVEARDWHDLPAGPFDGAYVLGGALATLPEHIAVEILDGLASRLDPGARLVVEVPAVAALASPSRTWSTPLRSAFLDEPHLLLAEHWTEAEFDVARWLAASTSGLSEYGTTSVRYDADGVARLAGAAGIEPVSLLPTARQGSTHWVLRA